MNKAAMICVVLLLLCAALAFAMHRGKGNRRGVFAKTAFRIKSLRVFPLRALAYAFFAVSILFFALTVADRAGTHEREYREDLIKNRMTAEKVSTGLDYPLMASGEKDREGRATILVVGDSFAWGFGLSNTNQIWWSIMSAELDRRGYDCRVYAAALPGANTLDEFGWLRNTSLLEDIAPDLILLGYVGNDHDAHQKPRYGILARRPNRPDAVFPSLYDHIGDKIVDKFSEYGFTYEPVGSGQLAQYDADVLRPFGEFARALGIPLAVIPTPQRPRPGFANIFRLTLPLFEKAGFAVYDPLEDFIRRYPNPESKYFSASAVDEHPGPATSWFLGKFAADVVEQNYASVLGEKRTQARTYPIEINDWRPAMLGPRAVLEGSRVSQYVIEYPDQSSEPFVLGSHGNFLTLPLNKKYVKLNFKNPVRLSCVKIEGEDLLSCEVWTLGINEKLGFDDQKPVRLGRRKGGACLWTDRGRREATSLLISAKTAGGKQAALTVTIEGEVNP